MDNRVKMTYPPRPDSNGMEGPQFKRAEKKTKNMLKSDFHTAKPIFFVHDTETLKSFMVPSYNGVYLCPHHKEALWDKCFMAAPRPRTPSER